MEIWRVSGAHRGPQPFDVGLRTYLLSVIQVADSDAKREEVSELLHSIFDDIDANAVPMTAHDDLYRPLVIEYRDDSTRQLLGAALTCRAQVAAATALANKRGVPLAPAHEYTIALDKHSELDLIGVTPEARGRGVGSKMLSYLETQLSSQGVRVWFGNVSQNLEADRLRRFYDSHGFTVLEDGQPLPQFFGCSWFPPATEMPAYFFYKYLSRR